jgi:hypothetical protein
VAAQTTTPDPFRRNLAPFPPLQPADGRPSQASKVTPLIGTWLYTVPKQGEFKKMAMPLYLGVWNSLAPISDEEAAHQYQLLKDVGSERRFDDKVYAFYSRLISLYPEIDALPEDELDDSPWACSMEVSGSHVIMAILPEKCDKVVPQVLTLAEENGLVCFDPQAGQVYLPPHLAAKQGDAAAPRKWSVRSEPKRSDPPAIPHCLCPLCRS